MHTKTLIHRQIHILDVEAERAAINRLFAAAVVSRKFCALLLNDPRRAISAGFSDEQFDLSPQTQDVLATIKAATLQEFAASLIDELRWLKIPLAL
jgi:hypothetical protein